MNKKTALITGASRGIGEGIAKEFAKNGYNLVLTCLKSEGKLNALANKLHKNLDTEILTHCGDISHEFFVEEVLDSVKVFFGKIDVLVNNAGVWEDGLVHEMSLDSFRRIIDVNVVGTYMMTKAFVPMMISQKSGCIINVSSIWGNHGASMESAYSASKGAINAFTKSLAYELAPSNIRVNAIAPGVIDTDMNSSYTKQEKEDLVNRIPLNRFGTPADIGKTALGIVNSLYMTGQIITVDGGFL